MSDLRCRIKEYIQPFERKLALQELRALTESDAVAVDGNDETALTFAVPGCADPAHLRESLAYWRSVGDHPAGLTAQVRREATSLIARNGVPTRSLPESVGPLVSSNLPRKRCLRYATHGLHEYRGKFFPQLVAALMNVAKVPKGGIILDPMCGSGTTLVEARLTGRMGYGLDLNPLSVFIAHVKCQALDLTAAALVSAYEAVRHDLERRNRLRRSPHGSLCQRDREYLERWFAPPVLAELGHIAAAIDRLGSQGARNFYRASLSNILRGVSWQKTDDLRVRREYVDLQPGESVARFLKEAERSTRTVAAFLADYRPAVLHEHLVKEGDARQAVAAFPNLVGRVDAVITSPPYATALPYIDTDRLSLIYLELLSRESHRSLDMRMIGNREITRLSRSAYMSHFHESKHLLPTSTAALIERIDELNGRADVGFRRRNLSALLSRYFFDMRTALEQAHELLRPGGTMFVVIGNNRTTAGGVSVEINTGHHLAMLGSSIGFRVRDTIAMEMLVSRDIFRKNAMPSEQIIRLEKI